MLIALSTPHPSVVCLTLASSLYGGTKHDGTESDANKLPLGQQTEALVHVSGKHCLHFSILHFVPPSAELQTQSWGRPGPGQSSSKAALATPACTEGLSLLNCCGPTQSSSTLCQHLNRDNADNYLLCAPNHLSAASTPVETCKTVILFTCYPCSCTTLLSTMSMGQSSLCCRSRNSLFLPTRHISH